MLLRSHRVFFLTFYFILKNLICSAVCGNAVTCPVRKGTRGRLGSTTKTCESERAQRGSVLIFKLYTFRKDVYPRDEFNCIQKIEIEINFDFQTNRLQT